MTVPRVETTYISGDRWYIDPGSGKKVPGVSAIVSMMPKALTNYYATSAASFAVDNLDVVSALARTDAKAALELVRGAADRRSKKARDLGTEVHTYAEALMRDKMAGRKSTFRVPSHIMDFLRSFARFADEFNVIPQMVETTVWDDEVGYAGTLDALYRLTLPDGREIDALVDTKSGASGVWPEAALQQTAYARAKWYIDPATGTKMPMPAVDAAFGLWLRPQGYALIPLCIDQENWEQFKRLRASWEWKRTREKHCVGKAINADPIRRQWSGR